MKGYVANINEKTLENENFREVLFTAENSQLVVMSLLPGEDIGMEIHDVDQFIRIEQGSGLAVLEGEKHEISDDWAIIIPAGTQHNVINSEEGEMKLYTIYSPAHHPGGTIHKTKEEAMEEGD